MAAEQESTPDALSPSIAPAASSSASSHAMAADGAYLDFNDASGLVKRSPSTARGSFGAPLADGPASSLPLPAALPAAAAGGGGGGSSGSQAIATRYYRAGDGSEYDVTDVPPEPMAMLSACCAKLLPMHKRKDPAYVNGNTVVLCRMRRRRAAPGASAAQDEADSLAHGTHKLPGPNIFPLTMVLGPDWVCLCFTYALVLGLAIPFNVFIAPQLHTGVLVAGVLLMVATVLSLALTAFSNPGILPKQSAAELEMQTKSMAEQGLTGTYTICPKCNVIRMPKTTHCYDCNSCILELDHHCPWTGKCIGKYNLSFFHAFLVCIFGLIIYCAVCLFVWILVRANVASV